MKKSSGLLSSRLPFIVLFLLIQIGAIWGILAFFQEKFILFYVFCLAMSLLVALYIINSDKNPAYKMAWLIPILILPVFGALLYVMFGVHWTSRRRREQKKRLGQQYRQAFADLPLLLPQLREENLDAALQAGYLIQSGAPLYAGSSCRFLPRGEDVYQAMLEDLRQAQRFIFLEYFIIAEGKMWDSILEILTEKARKGVDIRLIYDDIGCMFTLKKDYPQCLQSLGIKTCVFGRFVPFVSSRFNNRDHRKICVIDGAVGYTGGVNLADEYINAYEKYGHWLDCGERLSGAAVWSLTVMFLGLWSYLCWSDEDFRRFAPPAEMWAAMQDGSRGYVVPFSDSPFDAVPVGASVYMNMITRARQYVYIATPYLVLNYEMSTALRLAAKSGVDVRIITPHIPDKKMVFAITRSYYRELVQSGVKIYEYLPGFIHSKTFVSDDQYAVVGTINLDFRSLYLHYECGVWQYGVPAVAEIKEDYLRTLEKCTLITKEKTARTPWHKRLVYTILRVFAPLV